MNNNQIYSYKGAIHIHSKLSDGTGDIKAIAKAAKQVGLDWVIITDHNYYDNDESIIDGVYVIKAQEISPHQCNHYLAFDVNDIIEPEDNPQIYVDKVRELGGFGFAAHPDEGTTVNKKGEVCKRKNSNHCIPWTNKDVKPDGVEIWNWFSNWADNLDDSNIFTLAYAYLFKHKIIKKPSDITLEWWDKLNNETESIVPALGGVDAHALKIYKYIIPVTVFPYKTCFSTITNTIFLKEPLSENIMTAKKQILNAIKNGNSIITNQHISKDLPDIYVTCSSGKYYCGENIVLDDECCLHFNSNQTMKICLIYNGCEISKSSSDKLIYPIKKSGKYRLEVQYKNQGFLYTNPFNIKE